MTAAALRSPLLHQSLPAPADAQDEAVGFARWRDEAAACDDRALAAFMRDLAADPGGERLLAALFGNSPFLTQCCLLEPAFVRRLVENGPDAAFPAVMATLDGARLAALGRAELMVALRLARRRTALLVAVADLAGLWSLEQVTGSLSRFADAALEAAVRHLLAAAAEGELILPDRGDPARGSGFIVLGMGKLGALELNYSSDVDLILLYDAERVAYRGRRGVQHCFSRLARELASIMGEHTAEGYVCRVDLRLRPDPGSTPPAVSRQAALIYYESAGQNWERAALIKARPVAGDLAAGSDFIAALAPFLWRRHLDFAAIQDIHSIKRQIDAHLGGGGIKVAGHNVKLGRGGIREIEFFAQTQQLIWGGRVPELRAAATCDALAALARAHRISGEAEAELAECYRYLRRVEHRLQMVNDAQTHSLPHDGEGLRRIAVFLGYPDRASFDAELTRVLATVERHYAHLFMEAPTLAARGNLVFTGFEDDPDTLATLARMGFADPAAVSAMVRGWHHGRSRAMRSQRARELLTELVPTLLQAFGASANPDFAIIRFDRFLARLPAGVQLFSLFTNNPPLVALVAEIMAAGPRLADEIARRPGLLDSVLSAGFFNPPPPLATLAAELDLMLDRARHYEDLLDFARRWVGERKFQVGVQLLRRRLDGEAAGAAFSDIAEAALSRLLPRVEAEFALAHGAVKGGAMMVLGLGKLGSREMTVTSDLDLILIYDAPDGNEASDGARPLPALSYYARLAQRFINALTALTSEGNLYEIDMRLRPSGAKGPLATSFAAFSRYHDEMARTWEQMSLTRARPVAGPAALGAKVMACARGVLTRRRDPDRLVVEVDDMRMKIAEQHRAPPKFELKHRRGGMVDIEFIAQYLQLRVAADRPEVLHQNTRDALAALAAAGALARDAAEALSSCLALWRDLQSLMKLTVDEPFDEEAAAPALRAVLAAGAGAFDFAALSAQVEEAASQALTWYERLVAAPAEAARSGIELPSQPPSREEEHAP
jgi:[glutamine synthetase] adenylyltransferase / [glutamine synthetase]-adenylyl-L-tyrosine phosphorylase